MTMINKQHRMIILAVLLLASITSLFFVTASPVFAADDDPVFAEIADRKTGADVLKKIQGKDREAVFQRKDSEGNVKYCWVFNGQYVDEPRDLDMRLDISEEPFEGCDKFTDTEDVLYIHMNETGPLQFSLELNTNGYWEQDYCTDLYMFDGTDTHIAISGACSNDGWIVLQLPLARDYVLVPTKKSEGYSCDGTDCDCGHPNCTVYGCTDCDEEYAAAVRENAPDKRSSVYVWIPFLLILAFLTAAVVAVFVKKTGKK